MPSSFDVSSLIVRPITAAASARYLLVAVFVCEHARHRLRRGEFGWRASLGVPGMSRPEVR
jgi:hypothetical protein